MTFFTLGGKCGALAAPNRPSPSKDASAMRPTPMPQRPKKWRRVSSCVSRSSNVMASFPRHEIVQVEEHARSLRPCSQLGILFLAALVSLQREESRQAIALDAHRLASKR